jgi:opacity protein-like surface antigen
VYTGRPADGTGTCREYSIKGVSFMSLIRSLTALILALLIVAAAAAPSSAETSSGMKELGVSISSQRFEMEDTAQEINTTIINLLYGYFLTSRVEFAGNLSIIENDLGTDESTQTCFELQGKFHFTGTASIMLPYLGVQAGVYTFDDGAEDISGNSYGMMGGVKYFVTPGASLNMEYSYRAMELKDKDNVTHDAHMTVLGIGYSVYF